MEKEDKFYKSARWQRIRKSVLARDLYTDQVRARYSPVAVDARMVHHIFPRDLFPQWQWEKWNLISVSREAPEKVHKKTWRGTCLKHEGIELARRTAAKNNIDFDAPYALIKAQVDDVERKTQFHHFKKKKY